MIRISTPVVFLVGFHFCAVLWCAAAAAQETPLTEKNSWPLKLPTDPFSHDAILDLRFLNEERSGQSGFIRKSDDGNGFVLGNGQPVRFWAVGTDGWKFSPEEMETHCRWLAKLGVNLVRLHVTVCQKQEGSQITDVNQEVIDGCHRLIATAKQHGIYVIISPYYAHFDAPKSWGLDGGRQRPEGVIYVSERLQNAYKTWTRAFYATKNPHTGLPIAKDPTVAILQILNEDSLFFWTQSRMAELQKRKLGVAFGKWLIEKHGSVSQAMAAWGPTARKHEHDDPKRGVVGVHDIYFLTQDFDGATSRRLNDQAHFMAEFQREFYAEMGRYLREELGCQQLLNATNWRTANDGKLKALERYSYHALDIDAENEYVGSDFQHEGDNDHYRIEPGHYLVNESVLPKPFEISTNWIQEEGHPFIVTETAWKNPSRYQSEGPFLAAAYQSLNGVDAVCWFSCQTPRYEEDPLKPFWRIGDQMAMHKWNHCYPAMMASFPANALLYRRGYLKESPPVVTLRRGDNSMWRREIPPLTDNETHGDQRNPAELQPGWKPVREDAINRAVFQVGAVRSVTGSETNAAEVAVEMEQFFAPQAGVIRSVTNQLAWHYRDEFATMDSPKAQGVTGFLSRNQSGIYRLSDVTIESGNDYATVNVVSLDGQPLSVSQRILVQVVTVNRLTGYETKPATFTVGKGERAYTVEGEQIVRIGQPPFRIANTRVTLSIDNPKFNEAVVLDINGYPRGEPLPVVDGRFTMPENAIYAVLRDCND